MRHIADIAPLIIARLSAHRTRFSLQTARQCGTCLPSSVEYVLVTRQLSYFKATRSCRKFANSIFY